MITLAALLLLTPFNAETPPTATPEVSVQIAGALSALPHLSLVEGTEVRGMEDGQLIVLQAGDGPYICLADNPSDDSFHAACYHRSLEPFMQRGRELKAEGVEGKDRTRIRHEEVDAKQLEMPSGPATLASISGKSFDATTGQVEGATRIYVVYMPFATGESTGLPTAPNADQPSAPWIMRAGTASAHMMITPRSMEASKPPMEEDSEGEEESED